MTHIENIPHILVNGITHQRSANSNQNYKAIGYSGLISKRENFTLPNGNRLGAYIPFYFGVRMPMLYVMMLGNKSTSYALKPLLSEDIVYCITSVEQILAYNLRFVFSNGHAVSDLTDIFDEDRIQEIENLIDLKAINATYWVDESDLDLKRRKEAEFLVENDIPVSAILGFAVFNSNAGDKLIELGVAENKIVIKHSYYF